MKQIFWILMIAVAVVLATAWSIHHVITSAVNRRDMDVRSQSGQTSQNNAATVSGNQPVSIHADGISQSAQPQASGLNPPASDSILRNPPNGMIFAGSGKYQIYRQGDLTWRFNTDTGDACVLFATDAQWSQQRVYQHGCGAS